MGRSSKSQAEQNRARILDVATGLFRQHGVAAVSIADVMKAAGMTQGGFYTHFESKDALAAEACTTAFVRAVGAWKEKVREAGDGGSGALRDLVAYYFAPKSPGRNCPMIGLGHDAGAQTPGHPLHVAYSEGVRRLFDAFSEVAEANGNPSMSREQTMIIFAAMIGSNLLARAIGPDPWMEEMQNLVLGSVSKTDSP
ncbi:TetR/AcrR family transcriptional regulator [Paraburkholderia sp.]|uniref:TetR/AcrR family transcriptional regulator n=1 Tax=Paraburkholderia sp. TaxID=1926495 RepID=UPI003D6E8565